MLKVGLIFCNGLTIQPLRTAGQRLRPLSPGVSLLSTMNTLILTQLQSVSKRWRVLYFYIFQIFCHQQKVAKYHTAEILSEIAACLWPPMFLRALVSDMTFPLPQIQALNKRLECLFEPWTKQDRYEVNHDYAEVADCVHKYFYW